METLLGLIVGLAIGGVGVWLVTKSQIQILNSQKQASEEKITIYSSQRDTLDRENEEKKQKIDILETSLKQKEQELRSSLERVSKANAKLEQISNLEERLETERSVNQNYTDNIASYREKISQQATEIRNFEQRINELRHELQQAVSEKNGCREELEQVNQKIADRRDTLDRENEEKKQRIDTLETSLSQKEQELRSSLERVSRADAKLEQISDLEAKLQTEKNINKNYADNITSQKEEISKLTTESKNFEQRINELRHELQQTVLEKNDCREELELANQKSAEADAQKGQLIKLEQELSDKNNQNLDLQSQIRELEKKLASLETQLEKEQNSAQEKIDLLRDTKQNLVDTFKALSASALQNNNQQFIEVAKETFANINQNSHQQIDNLVSPLNSSLKEFKQQINQIENTRQENRGQIVERLENQADIMSRLQSETANLTKALRQPTVRGRWGEIQLRRVVEISGMLKHCDFYEQETVRTEDGTLRPDMIVKLPANKEVIIDSKAPLQAYLEAAEAQDESSQIEHLRKHERHIRTHIDQLSSRDYWRQFECTPEFVVMFLPGEVFFSAALQQNSELIEYGINKKVILATPTTLIALLKTIEHCWKQEQIANNAQKIGDLGRELYERFGVFNNHFDNIRKKLDDTVKTYNQAVGSYNSRVLVSARRLQEIGRYSEEEIVNVESINKSFRSLTQNNSD